MYIDPDQVEAEELLPNLRGLTIIDWQLGEGGMHLKLGNGKLLVLIGAPLIAYLQDEERTLN